MPKLAENKATITPKVALPVVLALVVCLNVSMTSVKAAGGISRPMRSISWIYRSCDDLAISPGNAIQRLSARTAPPPSAGIATFVFLLMRSFARNRREMSEQRRSCD
jgi:hypothetical protein